MKDQNISNKDVKCIDLGMIDYKEAWEFQEKLFDETVATKISNRSLPDDEKKVTPNYLIFCSHPHVYTLGKSGKQDHLLLDEEGLSKNDAKFYKINRGGDITYHGPGQIVGYPILDLDHFFTDIHKYLRFLEEAVIRTLADYNVSAGRVEGLTGVWIEGNTLRERKICALGVKSSRWVTMHGFAMNVHTDMNYFKNIVPCGINDKAVTSLEQEIGEKPDMKEVQNKLKNHLKEIFEFVWLEE